MDFSIATDSTSESLILHKVSRLLVEMNRTRTKLPIRHRNFARRELIMYPHSTPPKKQLLFPYSNKMLK